MTYPVRTFSYAKIYNVVDGDTCDIELDLGFSMRVFTRFRLAEIDTPERGKPGAVEATEFLKTFLNVPVVIESTKLDKYGRYLAKIYSGNLCINDEMIAKGLAIKYGG